MDISGGTVRLVDLVGTDGLVRDLHASDATVVGPAIVVPLGASSFNGCSWDAGGGGPEAVVWEIDAARSVVVGAVGLQDCSFERCQFMQVGFAGTADAVKSFFEGTQV